MLRRRRSRRSAGTRTLVSTAVVWLCILALHDEERSICSLYFAPMCPGVFGAIVGTSGGPLFHRSRRDWTWQVYRGGAVSNDDDEVEEEEGSDKDYEESDEKDDCHELDSEERDDNMVEEEAIETESKLTKKLRKRAIDPFSAAFRMNEAVKEEALKSSYNTNHDEEKSDEEREDEEDPPSNDDEALGSTLSEGVSVDSNTSTEGLLLGGGAAMIKAQQPASRRTNNTMTDFDTSRVAPLSSRLLKDDLGENANYEDEEDVDDNDDQNRAVDDEVLVSPEKTTKGPSTRDMTDVGKYWWVNMRQMYLSEMQDVGSGEEETDEQLASENDMSAGEEEDDQLNTEALDENDDEDEDVEDLWASVAVVAEEETIDLDESIEDTKTSNEPQTPTTELNMLGTSDFRDEEKLAETLDLVAWTGRQVSPYTSSGVWYVLDNILTLGLASQNPAWRLSRGLRGVRKLSARVSGLHGILSGKPRRSLASRKIVVTNATSIVDDEGESLIAEVDGEMSKIRNRLAAIERAREGVERAMEADSRVEVKTGWFGRARLEVKVAIEEVKEDNDALRIAQKKLEEEEAEKTERAAQQELEKKEREAQEELEKKQREAQEELEQRQRELEKERQREIEDRRRMDRVKEIDKLMLASQVKLQQLACEKDVLQRRPNPLWNYTTTEKPAATSPASVDDETNSSSAELGIQASRKFSFPPPDLVEEYLEMMFSSRRLIKMNHTFLWKDSDVQDDNDDDTIGDDLLTPSADAHKLYKGREADQDGRRKNGRHKNGGGGSWLLRQSIVGGPSLGEKIGETAENAAYKAICAAVMSFLARTLSSLHGINVMKYSDIRLVLESAPDLPPVGAGVIPGSSDTYAQEAIQTVIRKKTKKQKKRSKHRALEDLFLQRDAVTEMLLSHVQISAPLLKLFPLAWQRAFLGNIITLATAVMSDFFDGVQFQILGHQLSFAFKPITEVDMINHLGFAGGGFNHRRARPEQFEAAVQATAADIGEDLKFLDRWHERALGSGVLRTQIANLIARIILTLADEVLSGARMDLWSAPAGGPRMLAGLEYRTKKSNIGT